jgi:hypothetical protein
VVSTVFGSFSFPDSKLSYIGVKRAVTL